MRFPDRREAGRSLAGKLTDHAGREGVIVLGLPRGGVPVAYEVAAKLGVPLDVFTVRKLGVPGHEELAMGAIAPGGVRVLNTEVLGYQRITDDVIERVAEIETAELARREALYRSGRAPVDVDGKTVIVVDDGLATGSTMRAAIGALRQMNAARIIVAVPVAAKQVCESFAHVADEIVCDQTPDPFYAVGMFYEDFSSTSDEEIHDLLERAGGRS
ncbi:MAG: phosphoribosyltransferase [Actinobacteria bacterium]|nr:phosphoribosyltransferase [Actinomycetota bacterium]